MPAIQLERLRRESTRLGELFDDPQQFIRHFRELLEFHADRTRRAGQSGAPAPLISAFHVHPQVLRQIGKEIAARAAEEPQTALTLADRLWEEPILEFRLLAARLIGNIPPDPPEPVLKRISAWVLAEEESALVDALLTDGSARLRQQQFPAFLNLLEDWFSSTALQTQALGLRALIPLINDPSFENLPSLLRFLQPILQEPPPDLKPYLRDVLQHLGLRSPREAAFLLRQSLVISQNAGTAWLVRKTIPVLPDDLQAAMREVLKG